MNLSKDALDTITLLAEVNTPMTIVKLVQFVDSLTDEQKAELMALIWLGRDGGRYLRHLSKANKRVDDKVGYYMAEQGPALSSYLRLGIQNRKG